MYYPYFVTYMIVGLVISLGVFFWALQHGQFKDQQRARFLALGDEDNGVGDRVTVVNRYEGYALLLLAIVGLGLTAVVLVRAVMMGA
jgi:cbb3-type cytochrome oxidase maturation protein